MIKNYFRILKKPHAHLQTILKTPVKFHKDRTKTVGGVKGTKYLQKIRNHAPRTTHHAPRKTKNSVPPLFFEKAEDTTCMKCQNCLFILTGSVIQIEVESCFYHIVARTINHEPLKLYRCFKDGRTINPYTPEFMKWTLFSLTMVTSISANSSFSQKPITEWQTV